MVRRTAAKGQNRGNDFWGCPNFSSRGCRETVAIEPTRQAAIEANSKDTPKGNLLGGIASAIGSINKTVDRFRRWSIELTEPDANGYWDPDERYKALKYVYRRDGGRCGLCGRGMPLEGAQVEHIIPKVFGYFDIRRGGRAVEGEYYESLLHRLDNLQAAHSYCNRRKGNKTDVKLWRHSTMPPLAVAVAKDGQKFVVPWQKTKN